MHIIAKYLGQSAINSLVHTSHTYYWEVEMLCYALLEIDIYFGLL